MSFSRVAEARWHKHEAHREWRALLSEQDAILDSYAAPLSVHESDHFNRVAQAKNMLHYILKKAAVGRAQGKDCTRLRADMRWMVPAETKMVHAHLVDLEVLRGADLVLGHHHAAPCIYFNGESIHTPELDDVTRRISDANTRRSETRIVASDAVTAFVEKRPADEASYSLLWRITLLITKRDARATPLTIKELMPSDTDVEAVSAWITEAFEGRAEVAMTQGAREAYYRASDAPLCYWFEITIAFQEREVKACRAHARDGKSA